VISAGFIGGSFVFSLRMPKWPKLKWAKMMAALALVPVCLGALKALWKVLQISGAADTFWVAAISGAACWLVVYHLLPKPMLVYVFGHELTHALWVWLFGGKVKKFKATSRGGHVVVSRSNFVIALAPYFFPLYTLLVALLFGLGDWIWGWQGYLAWFHLAVGAAYAFHVTLTWHVLQTRQSDLEQQGYLFSAVILFLGNVIVLLVGVPLLAAQVQVLTALHWWLEETGEVLKLLGRMGRFGLN
jgi:hypothetical protein